MRPPRRSPNGREMWYTERSATTTALGEADLSGGAISTRRACYKSTNWLYARHPFGRRHAIATAIIKACSRATGARTDRDALPVLANHSSRAARVATRLLG